MVPSAAAAALCGPSSCQFTPSDIPIRAIVGMRGRPLGLPAAQLPLVGPVEFYHISNIHYSSQQLCPAPDTGPSRATQVQTTKATSHQSFSPSPQASGPSLAPPPPMPTIPTTSARVLSHGHGEPAQPAILITHLLCGCCHLAFPRGHVTDLPT
ncbi:uncharacterized protein K444DRAFT_6070 [Hyaloscypha bicolor E]|uniref:Uncharacterized protein n=1 Tax=Hyaloscypha bicolor E TaxID=1095630 RepID=A0A2J6TVY0_9HELO|nr:uncharacterized protein K444DRAFT_6070 [Hyaloscypha bicolor E]PMD67108.1 hypothetical protein K444DRAFT_6070 [Hyaloscypha bicolor E]